MLSYKHFIDLLKRATYYLLNEVKQIASPPFCASCKVFLEDYTVLCSACFLQLKPIVSSTIKITESYHVSIFAVSSYEDPLKKLILSKDYYAPAISIQLGQLMIMRTPFLSRPCDIIVPIPLHWSRQMWRGYNQSTIMAQEMARISQKPVAELLTRSRNTRVQKGLSQGDRQKNVAGVFGLKNDNDYYRNKHIALIDDVYTTGSTMREAIKALRLLNPASISVYVVARVVD